MSMSACRTSEIQSKYNQVSYGLSLRDPDTSDCKSFAVGFLTPAQFYKSLLASAVLQQQQAQHKSLKSNIFGQRDNLKRTAKENQNVSPIQSNKPWSTANGGSDHQHHTINHSNNNNQTSSLLLSPSVTNTPTPPDINLPDNFEVNRKSTPIASPTIASSPATTASKRREDSQRSNNNNNHSTTSKSELLSQGFLQQCNGASNMPIGGVQSQNPTQGLVHWMSVMAEHMNVQSHHDPTPVGMHAYMWNGNVDVCRNKSNISNTFKQRQRHSMTAEY